MPLNQGASGDPGGEQIILQHRGFRRRPCLCARCAAERAGTRQGGPTNRWLSDGLGRGHRSSLARRWAGIDPRDDLGAVRGRDAESFRRVGKEPRFRAQDRLSPLVAVEVRGRVVTGRVPVGTFSASRPRDRPAVSGAWVARSPQRSTRAGPRLALLRRLGAADGPSALVQANNSTD